jgi:hypothetical protein
MRRGAHCAPVGRLQLKCAQFSARIERASAREDGACAVGSHGDQGALHTIILHTPAVGKYIHLLVL